MRVISKLLDRLFFFFKFEILEINRPESKSR